jgi:spore germination cell wall hydrolase CwlJ-like protein
VVCYENTAGHIIGPNPGRRFFADRRGGARHHVGLDVFCREGDVTVACANGKIVNYYAFYRDSHGVMSFALFIAHDGVVINYGEVKGNAPNEFGWKIGDTVTAGQKIARVSGTNMIHFETYEPGTTANARWLSGQSKPARLQNPTMVLLNLAAGAKRIMVDGQTSQSSQSSHTSQSSQPSQTSGNAKTPTKTGVPLTDNDLLTLARTIYGEARDQAPAGRAAVGHVVVNRLLARRFRNTIADVCQQPLQFSCWNVGDPNREQIVSIRPGANKVFDQCLDAAAQVLHGQLQDNTGGATHYYATYIRAPNWTRPPSQFTTQIGVHKFYTHVA